MSRQWCNRLAGLALVLAATAAGCQGDIGDGGEPVGPSAEELGVGEMGMRRLTIHEYDSTLRDLLNDPTRPGAGLLPEDARTPYDNGWHGQIPSRVLIDAAETLALDVASRLVADDARRDAIVGCSPSGPSDEACLREFVTRFGRLALRRSLGSAEVDDFVILGLDYANQTNDFYTGVEVVVAALLQTAEFLYRVEVGAAVEGQPGLFRLDGFQLATRMAYLIWGSGPDATLLDLAASGGLDSGSGRRDTAASMLDDPRARAQVDRFHAMWLGYETLPHDATLTAGMRRESAALVERVVFDAPSSWLDLFRSGETFIDDAMAAHYGLPAVGSTEPVWVDVAEHGRKGILSHGSFLSAGSNPLDTSPTKRGALIRERLMCSPVPEPPPDVMADDPPDGTLGNCKIDQYAIHSEDAGCASCHALMDPVGFGLENYDRAGRFRAHDDGKPECVIAGDGELTGVGMFNGPAELSDLLVAEQVLDACAVRQLFEYAMGRDLDERDDAYVGALAASFSDSDHRFDQLIMALVGHEAFGYRLEPKETN
jgi:Protein of unknown function (DUF1588)/Protein of unknown function (DUF1592)/Protein of unknown function (DUF1585)/Protein of unknown function (DUF1595)/Protein of unknown function (DUF1587)